MNIIIEGPDGVGKSTTIQNIKNYYNDIVFTNIYYTGVKMPDEDKYEYMVKLFSKMWNIFETFDNIISDRSHISEHVFATIYRGQDTNILFEQEEKYLEISKGTVLIMLIDTTENLMDREDGLSLSTTEEQKQKELDLYKEGFSRSNLPKLVLNIRDLDKQQVLDKIVHRIEKWRKDGII